MIMENDFSLQGGGQLGQQYRWKNKQIRQQVSVINGEKSPTLLLKNARFLHSVFRQWMIGNIWIYDDRIVYVGDELPVNTSTCEIVDCTNFTLVPGYIEPHVHPFLLYNPQSFAQFSAQTGTTTMICDNLFFLLQLQKKRAFSLIDRLDDHPVTFYWWNRFDAQTELNDEEEIFSNSQVKSWIEHEKVIQGGELTGWPKLAAGDDLMLQWVQETKRLGKKIEGHFPGASEKTLVRMMLFGASGDHEAMTGADVYKRLLHGYTVSLRYSSIRPDLPVLLEEMKELGVNQYDSLLLTTDGSTPSFYKQGVIDQMIEIALEHGVPVIDAYAMASYNVARYYNLLDQHGMITTGRIANINFLLDERKPTPFSVLAKGKWVKREGEDCLSKERVKWGDYGINRLTLNWDLTEEDLQFSMPFGIEMLNSVITKPYSIALDMSGMELPKGQDESFFMLLDRNGKWRINTILKGFATDVGGLASSLSTTGDLILIGKSKREMTRAFERMKEIGGGIVLVENDTILHEVELPLAGFMSNQPFLTLMQEDERLKHLLIERGYRFADPIYSLFFLSSTHLPYIRVTQQGMYDVMNKKVLFPTLMR